MRLLLPSLVWLATSGFAPLAYGADLLANGSFARGAEGWGVSGLAPDEVRPARDGDTALLSLRAAPGDTTYARMLAQPVAAAIREGDHLVLEVRARSAEGCRVLAFVEEAGEPWAKPLAELLTLEPAWRTWRIEGLAPASWGEGEWRVGFHLAYDTGTVEVADVHLRDLDLEGRPEGARGTMEQPLSLIEADVLEEPLSPPWDLGGGERNRVEVAPSSVEGFPLALRCTLAPEPGAAPWSLSVGQRTSAPVRGGDVVYLRAWLRGPEGARVTFVFEQATPDHRKYVSQLARLTPQWQEFRFAGVCERSYEPGAAQAKLFLGEASGEVEIAGFRAESYGRADLARFDQTIDWWAGRPHSDDWRAAALERIERIRKSDVRVVVRDAEGRAIPEARVRVAMTRHGFRFGTAAPAARLVDTTDPNSVRFQQEVARLFNEVTFENDLKWAVTSPQNLELVDRATEWCRERGIEVRGHCLLWGSYEHLPPGPRALRGEALWEACVEHIRDYATRMKGRVYLWDVVNEAANNTELWDEVGWERFAEAFRLAHEADPDALLCYNDFGIIHDNSPGQRDNSAKRIQYLLDHGAPVTTLGLQSHCGIPLTPIDRVLANLDRWAAFGKRLEVTEYDLSCRDDRVQAEWTRDFLTAVFSHPAVDSFIEWGFWEGSHWLAREGGASFRLDWSKRPSQEAWEELVLGEWWTDWSGSTDGAGLATLRAFHGTHEVTVEVGGESRTATVEVIPGEASEVEVRL